MAGGVNDIERGNDMIGEIMTSVLLLLLVTRYSSMIVDTKTRKRKVLKWALELTNVFLLISILINLR